MDDYLSKPIEPRRLFEVVEHPEARAAATVTADAGPVSFDEAALLERASGDTGLMADLVALFLDDCPSRLAAIHAAVESRDPEGLRTSAHALKGAAGNLSALALAEAADVLERLGAESRMDAAQAAWRPLSVQAALLLDLLRRRYPASSHLATHVS